MKQKIYLLLGFAGIILFTVGMLYLVSSKDKKKNPPQEKSVERESTYVKTDISTENDSSNISMDYSPNESIDGSSNDSEDGSSDNSETKTSDNSRDDASNNQSSGLNEGIFGANDKTTEKADDSKESNTSSNDQNGNDSANSNRETSNLPASQDVANDTQAPIFLTMNKSPEIGVGSVFNVKDFIGYADNVDRDVEVIIDGAVDVLNTGNYPITVTLKDDAGNTKSADITVRVGNAPVVEEKTDNGIVSTVKPTEEFSDFMTRYKTDGATFGLDVSRWQGDIDFNKVKAAGCDFVIMRLGGFDDGELYTDRYYNTYLKDAKAAGLRIGIYWHAEENSPEQVKNSVNYLMGVLNGEALDFPISYDWEDFDGFENYGMNLQDINNNYATFCSEIKSHGYEAGIYSSLNFLENVWTNENNTPVWLAHYTDSTSYTGDYYMWQQTSKGHIDGVNTAVDFNVLYK